MMLRDGGRATPPRRSCTTVFHVVEGEGESTIDGTTFRWKRGDTCSAPVFAAVSHRAADGSHACLIAIHDRPLQEKLGFYEERAAA
jgi:gentisate 1,2-dioxygenase